MNPEKRLELIQQIDRRIKEVGIHNTASPETRERLAKLEVNQDNFMHELQEIKQMIKELKCDVKIALDTKADREEVNQIKSVLKWVGGAIGLAIVTFLTWLISNGTIHLINLIK